MPREWVFQGALQAVVDRENHRRQRDAQQRANARPELVHYWEDVDGFRRVVYPQWQHVEFADYPVPPIVQRDAVARMADPARFQVQAMPQPEPEVIPEPEIDVEEDKGVKVVNEFLIGCDPELIAIKDGKHYNVRYVLGPKGSVGWDHNGDVIEMRPRPAKTAFSLSKHLKDLVKTLKYGDKHRAGAYFKYEDGGVLGGVKEMTLGGHVHIDVPFELVSYEQRQRVAALDEVTHRLEELDVLTKAEMPLRRNRGKAVFAGIAGTPYGAFGDVKSADSANRLEYRTMPSWLYSPVTTFLALTGAKLAAAHPRETLLHFGFQEASKAKLRGFFELFSDKDVDAKRAVEMIFERNRSIVRDPEADVVKTWENEWRQIA
jgi:hypothetical protein